MRRGGRHGLRDYRRELLYPFAAASDSLKVKQDLSHREAHIFHRLQQLFVFAQGLKKDIYRISSSRALGLAAGLSNELVTEIINGPAETDQIKSSSEEEFPSWSRTPWPETPERSRSPVRQPLRDVRDPPSETSQPSRPSAAASVLIEDESPEQSVLEENIDVSDELPEQSVLEENIDVSDVRLGLFLDFHGVIDKDLRETRVLLHSVHQDLPQLRVYCLSFCKDPRKIANIRRICQDLQLIPIITPSKFGRWDGKRAYLDWQIRRDDLQSVFFVDDQRALVEHVCSNSEIARGRVLEEHQRIISLHGEITDHFYRILDLVRLERANP